MLDEQIKERARKERETYNQGLKRENYEGIMSHALFFYNQIWHERVIELMREFGENKVGIELGDTIWSAWVEDTGIYPAKLTCINISEKELEKGVELSRASNFKPEFRLMDAHALEFEDNSLDFVFGAGMLHHLQLDVALSEINRVLKPDGIMFFIEPLGINPVGKLVRLLTPESRTEDETPFGFEQLKSLDKKFSTSILYGQFTSVPLGILSKFLFKTPDNILMKTAFTIDVNLEKVFPPLKYLYRSMLITGKPKK
ncbi:class I SAM-dependent methyltransferase [Pannus brasiliensis CCIBt3594]|uniref:Class I SAM-dependent methyltransferase n=1 Tax=Pannus brasiliensis CCIBt3594 TaxID=1427578 RepID=A0AAW9QYR7_9CHRO